MFRSPSVGDITLDIVYDPSEDVEYTGNDCADCRQVTTMVMLRVTTNPQSTDPLILNVDGRQVFLVKRDPADNAQWVIFKQVDFDGPGKRNPGQGNQEGSPAREATESASSGKIKGLYQ